MSHQPPKNQRRGVPRPVLERLTQTSFHETSNSSLIGLDWRVEKLQHFINTEHGKLGWSLDSVCKQLDMGFSGSHAARLFKKQIGLGVREYTKRKRLAVAADKLKTTTLSIKEIAADLGYKSQSDLSRQFKRLFRLNPTEFRIAHRQASCQSLLRHGLNVTRGSLPGLHP